jgi:hypothetical protein
MLNYLSRFLDLNDPSVFDFKVGYLAGVAFAILVIFLIMVVKIIFNIFFAYPKRAGGIEIPRDNGNVFIASSAIIGLIKSYEKSFPALKIAKIKLMRKKSGYFLDVHFELDTEKATLPEIEEPFKGKIFEGLRNSFGIDSVLFIKCKVVKGSLGQ